MNKLFRNLAIAALTVALLLAGPGVRAQTNSWEQTMDLVRAAQTLAAEDPTAFSNQYAPLLLTNPAPSGLPAAVFSLQMNWPPFPEPLPQFAGCGLYLMSADPLVIVADDLDLNYAQEPLGGIMPYSLAMADLYSSPLSPPECGTGGPAYITDFNAALQSNGLVTIAFSIAGGQSNWVYPLSTAAAITGFHPTFTFLTNVYACGSYVISNQPAVQSYYRLGPPIGSTGTNFWFTFPNVTTDNVANFSLFISSPTAAAGQVIIPLLHTTNTFSLPAGGVTNVPIDTSIMIDEDYDDYVTTNGIHVVSTQPVSIYAFDYSVFESVSFTAYPTPLLGTNYCIIDWPGEVSFSEFAIVATAAGATTITITPNSLDDLYGTNWMEPIILQQGETYENNSYDPTGTVITSDKPVAVFADVSLGLVPYFPIGAGNPLVQQQLPVAAWGSQALTVGFAGRTNGDTYRVLAAYDGTVVTISGTIVTMVDETTSPPTVTATNETITVTNDAGDATDFMLEGPAVFQGSQPIQVAHFSNGAEYDHPDTKLGDPCEILLPPVGQYLKSYKIYVPGSSDFLFYDINTNFVNLIVPQSATTNTSLDGSIVAVTKFVAIGSSGYFGAQIPVTNGVHTIISSQPVGVEVYGFGSYDAYGYFGGIVK